MATDIVDKDLIKARNKRWDLAFSNSRTSTNSSRRKTKCELPTKSEGDPGNIDSKNTKATVVIEHLIQLSDVSHTMQHWHMYRRWNERLFEESYKAYVEGRAEKNPIDNWYQGELGFYDFYIIPLAKKIKQCAVFGVSSDEYLSYAIANRQEWQERGKEVLDDMVKKVEAIYHTGSNRQPGDLGTEVGGGETGLTSENAKPIASRRDSSREGSNLKITELENILEGKTSTSNSECEECGEASGDDQGRATKVTNFETGVKGSDDVPIFGGEDDETGKNCQATDLEDGIKASSVGQSFDNVNRSLCQVKELESVLEEGETINESEFGNSDLSQVDRSFPSARAVGSGRGDCKNRIDSASKDLEVVAVASNRNESSQSAHSEASLDKDSKFEISPKDVEMGLDASASDVTSATTNSKA